MRVNPLTAGVNGLTRCTCDTRTRSGSFMSMALAFPPEVHGARPRLAVGESRAVARRRRRRARRHGLRAHAPFTLALLRNAHALGDAPLAKIVNTHCHSDHMGGNAAIARAYGCPIAIPEGEAPLIEAWDEQALLLDYADQSAERFSVAEICAAATTYRWGDLDWHALAVPGHDMGALCFFNAEHGLLISGDALWANGFGFVMPPQIDPAALPATRATLEMLARLPIRIVIPGHGDPFDDVDAALARAFRRLRSFEADPDRLRLARAEGRAHVQAARHAARLAARRHARLRRARRRCIATSTRASCDMPPAGARHARW